MKNEITLDQLQKENILLKKETQHLRDLNQALSESEKNYKTILENSLAGIYVVKDGKFQIINSIAASYTGYSQSELVGKKADSIICPEDQEDVKQKARDMISGNRTSPYLFRIITKQKKIRWLMESVASTSYRGSPAILGISMDITDQKIAEEKTQESENLYRAIFETTGMATVIIEDDMSISLINSEFEKVTGYRKEDWQGKKKWPEYVAKEDINRMKKYHKLRRINPNAAPRNYEHKLIDSRGKIRNVFLTIDMIPGTKKSVSSFFDITEWRQAEKALKKREKELQNKSRNLQELNTTLRVLLKQREDDRQEFEEKVLSNVKEFVLPYVEKIKKSRMAAKDFAFVDILESNIKEIVSPFSRKLSSKYRHLTPKEIQIAHFIKEGKTSKEIADIMNVSKGAIDIHRYRLRSKLGLNKKKANLSSHLIALF